MLSRKGLHVRRFIWIVAITSFFAIPGHAAKKKEILTVYTYKSFLSKSGPANFLKEQFEKTCEKTGEVCQVNWVAAGHSASMVSRVLLEGDNTKADVLMGVDQYTAQKSISKLNLKKLRNQQMISNPRTEMILSHWSSPYFQPINAGIFAFMENSDLVEESPISLNHLFSNSKWQKQIFVQDPRTSSLGNALLSWFGNEFERNSLKSKFQQMRKNVLSVGSNWTSTYGLFLKGESKFVFSYLTSEIYHRLNDKKRNFKAVSFAGTPHPVQLENVAILKRSPHQSLALKWVSFLREPWVDWYIASKNFMVPIDFLKSSKKDLVGRIGRVNRIIAQSPLNPSDQEKLQAYARELFKLKLPKLFLIKYDNFTHQTLLQTWKREFR